jgi:hypothetical protein
LSFRAQPFFTLEELDMHKSTVLSAVAVFAVFAISTSAQAVPCYAKQGAACVKKSYGNLDSNCQNACAVGKTAESVQQALKDKGHDPGPIDGKAGAKTEKALRAFQKQQSLPVTGRMDKETVHKLGVEFR